MPDSSPTPPTDFASTFSFVALRRAAMRAAKGHRASPSAYRFLSDLEPQVLRLQRELDADRWVPAPLHRFAIRDPKPRIIAASAFRDRVVHHAVCAVLEPRLEAVADADSYACRVGRGSHRAVRRARALARHHPWFVKLDIRHFFETIPHPALAPILDRHLPDLRVRAVLQRIVDHGSPGGVGLPIGSLTSQHLGNGVLGVLDQFARRTLRVGGLVRYMDDSVWFGPDRATVCGWMQEAAVWLPRRLGVTLKDEATVIGPVDRGIPFLGFRVYPHRTRLDAARVRRLRRRLRELHRSSARDLERACRAGAVIAWASLADSLGLRRSMLAAQGAVCTARRGLP